jgi:hypothetical protein
MPKHTRRNRPDFGVWEPLHALRRKLLAQRNHPLYAARGNEQPLLQDLIDADPPEGGMAAYVADLDREKGSV